MLMGYGFPPGRTWEVRWASNESPPPVPRPTGPVAVERLIPTSPASTPIRLASVLVAAYAVVVFALFARLATSLMGIGRLRRSSAAVVDSEWLASLERLRRRLRISRPVDLARSSMVGVPVAGHAEAILLHELTHVRRGNFAWNVVLRVVSASYWPQPLAWLLGQMGGRSAYRLALLDLAEGLIRRPGPAMGLAMARSSKPGRRIAENDRGQSKSHCLPRWPTRLVVAGLVLALAATLGPARITRAKAQPNAVAQEPKPVDVRAPGVGLVFQLRVVAADSGKPVPRADVRVWMGLRGEDFRKTDDEGRITLIYDTGMNDESIGVDVWGDGFAMQRHFWGRDPKVPVPAEATLKLHPGESLGGLVQDEQGRPVSGAVVYLWSHNYKHQDPTELLYDLRAITGHDGRWHTGGAPRTTGDILGIYITHPDYISDREYVAGREKPPIDQLRSAMAVSVMKKGVAIEGRVLDADGKPIVGARVLSTQNPGDLYNGLDKYEVRTDLDGKFRTGQVIPGNWHLLVRARGHAPVARELKVGAASPFEEIRPGPPRVFKGRVVDPDGKPIQGAFVNIDTWQGYRCLGAYLYSDADGRVRWDDAPDDDVIVNVDRRGYIGLHQQNVGAGDGETTWTLRPSLAISGIVRDADTRKVILQADVEFGAVDPANGEVATWQKTPRFGPTAFFQGYLNASIAVEADAYKIRITADGYQPFVSRPFRRDEKVVLNYDVRLIPGKEEGPFATAIRADGKPLAGARVYRGRLNENLSIQNGQVSGRNLGRQTLTDAEGRFPIPQGEDRTLVLIQGDDCFAYANTQALKASPTLQTRRYGRVEGRLMIGDRVGAKQQVELSGLLQDDSTQNATIFFDQKTTTDAEGRFTFDKVIAMPGLRVSRSEPRGLGIWSVGEPVKVEDGATTTVIIGGKGRPVVGRVLAPEGWVKAVDFSDHGRASLETDQAHNPYPLELFRGKTSLNDPAWSKWMHDWPKTPEGRAHADARVAISVNLAPDGSFRIDDAPAGKYRLTIRVNEETRYREPGPFAVLSRVISIARMPTGRSDAPLDLGSLRLKVRTTPKVGDPAPAFEVTTVDGKKLAIPGDFQGKYLLLDVGTMWDSQSRLQITRINDVAERFGKDERFALLSLLMATSRPESREFVTEKGQPWPQAILEPLSNPIADAYGIEDDDVPAAILIGPDGKIAARDLHYQKIGEAIDRALQGHDVKP